MKEKTVRELYKELVLDALRPVEERTTIMKNYRLPQTIDMMLREPKVPDAIDTLPYDFIERAFLLFLRSVEKP